MYAIKQFYLKLFNAKTTMKDKTMMCDETKNECCNHADPPWEGPQVIPAQIRRVDNLIFRKINQFARENDVEQATPMHAGGRPNSAAGPGFAKLAAIFWYSWVAFNRASYMENLLSGKWDDIASYPLYLLCARLSLPSMMSFAAASRSA